MKIEIKKMQPKIGFIGEDRGNILEDLNFAIKNRFDYYEIQAAKNEKSLSFEAEIIEEIKKISTKNNISLNLHASYFIFLCSLRLEVPKAAFEIAKEEMILANKIGAENITIHSGDLDPTRGKRIKSFEILMKNLQELTKLGRKLKTQIGLENGYRPNYLCRKPEDLLKVVNSAKGLKIVFDVGHANVAGFNPIQYFKRVKDFVINIHVHDNDGMSDQHALIGEGNIDFKSLLKECKNSGYYGPFILELFPHKNVLKGREIFLNIWNQI